MPYGRSNYDYAFDYIFYLDGTMQVRTAASGKPPSRPVRLVV